MQTCPSSEPHCYDPMSAAGWSSLVARRAHNPKVAGSNPAPAIPADKAQNLQKPCTPADRDLKGHRKVAFVVEGPSTNRLPIFRLPEERWPRYAPGLRADE